jgi:hypothetical protein
MLEGIETIDAAADESLGIDPELGDSVATLDTARVAYTVRREREGNRTFRDLAGNVDNVYFTVSCSSVDDGWAWDQVASIANSQREKIKVSSGRNYRHQL